MYIIGITGKTGSGKSEVAKVLHSKLPNSIVIHLDYYWLGTFFEEKEKMIKIFGKDIFKLDVIAEKVIINGIYNAEIFKYFNEYVYFSNTYKMQIANEYIDNKCSIKILEEIEKKEKEGLQYIIIDFAFLFRLPNIIRKCDLTIQMCCSIDNRKARIKNRNEMQCLDELFSMRDGIYQESNMYDIWIDNSNDGIQELNNIADNIINLIYKKYQDGMIIGRFQPFIIGHMHYLKRALKRVPLGKKLYIGIGRPLFKEEKFIIGDDHNLNLDANPYTFDERKAMIYLSVMLDPEIKNRLNDIIIIPLPENKDNLNYVLNKFMLERNVTLYMNLIPEDKWERKKVEIFQNVGFKTIVNIVDLNKPRIESGTNIRKLTRCEDKEVEKKLPLGTTRVLDIISRGKFLNENNTLDDFMHSISKDAQEEKNISLLRTVEESKYFDGITTMLRRLNKILQNRIKESYGN